MAVGLLEGDGSVFEELDQGGAAYPEEVGRFLGGEEQALGGDEGGLALPHDLDHLAQDAVDLGGEGDLFAVGCRGGGRARCGPRRSGPGRGAGRDPREGKRRLRRGRARRWSVGAPLVASLAGVMSSG